MGEVKSSALLKSLKQPETKLLEQVIGQHKIGGQARARAMVVTGSIQRAIEYFTAFTAYLAEIKSPYQAIVAFSGEPEYKGEIPEQVSADLAYKNARKNSDRQNAKDRARQGAQARPHLDVQRRRATLQAVPGQRIR